jgi:hypothetical protein
LYEKLTDFLSKLRELEQICIVKSGKVYCGPQAECFCAEYERDLKKVLTSHVAALTEECEDLFAKLSGYHGIAELTDHYHRVIEQSLAWLAVDTPHEEHFWERIKRPDMETVMKWFREHVKELRKMDVRARWERTRVHALRRLGDIKNRHGH